MEKISMVKIKEVFRLKYETKLSARKISRALNISHTVVNGYIKRFEALSISYEELLCLSDKDGVLDIADPLSGEVSVAEIFVGVLGASGYPFVIAVASQKKADFIYAHNEMFKAFGGVPELLVPDNLKSAVTRADRYEPDLNPDYVKLASHYRTAIMPARGYKPQDKSLVENGVKLMQRLINLR